MEKATDKPLDRPEPGPRSGGTMTRPWWQRPWIVPLATVCVVFLVLSLPRYLTFDPARSRVAQPGDFALHYPLLVTHILFGAVAMVTCCLQVWPWLRAAHPAVHRVSGRLYVFAGVIPSGLLGIVVGATSPNGLTMQLSSVTLSVLWLIFTVAGWSTARQRRWGDHRRWMIRSFAATMAIPLNRVYAVVLEATVLPAPETDDPVVLEIWLHTLVGNADWPGWVTTLLIAEWWLTEKGVRAKHRARAARRKASATGTSPRTDPTGTPAQKRGTAMSTEIDLNALELTADPDQQNEVFLIAFNSYDGAVFDRLYRDDAISNLSGEPLTGAARKAKITEMLALKPSLKATLRESYTAGDVQLIVVDYEMEVPGPDGVRQELRGTCTDVLRRGADGKWLMAIDRPIPQELSATG